MTEYSAKRDIELSLPAKSDTYPYKLSTEDDRGTESKRAKAIRELGNKVISYGEGGLVPAVSRNGNLYYPKGKKAIFVKKGYQAKLIGVDPNYDSKK